MTHPTRGIGVHEHGGADHLVEDSIVVAGPGPYEVLVRTEALGLNPVDSYFRSTPWEEVAQAFPKQLPPPGTLRIAGADFAGVIEAIGPDVIGWEVGDAVYGSAPAMAANGAHSELTVIDSRLIAAQPTTLTPAQSVAWPMVGITVWESLFDILRICEDGCDAGASLLIIGGTGGTGSAAIQLAKFAGLNVTATAGSEEGAQWCADLGADRVLDHRKPLPTDETYDFILCAAPASAYIDVMAELIAPYGHICALVADLDPVPFGGLRLRSASFGVEFMGLRPMGPQIERHGQILGRITELIDAGRLVDLSRHRLSPIDAPTMRQAHELMEQSPLGKVTVSGWPAR